LTAFEVRLFQYELPIFVKPEQSLNLQWARPTGVAEIYRPSLEIVAVSLALRLQTVNQYILFVELANEKYISKSQSTRIGLTDPHS
jgi:hypothetical protein